METALMSPDRAHLPSVRARGCAVLALLLTLSPAIAVADPTVVNEPVLGTVADTDAVEQTESQTELETEVQTEAVLGADDILAMEGTDARPSYDEASRLAAMTAHDPFPDRPVRARKRDAAMLLTLGVGFAAGASVVGRYALLPDCEDESNVLTCEVPDGADIGVRSGRLFGTIAFSVGGAAFGAFGGRELGRLLDQADGPFERRRRIAVGIGATSLALGVAGAATGATVLGVGARRSVDLARSFDGTTSLDDPQTVDQLQQTVDEIRTARIGLMILAASPAFVATGISLLVHRPKRERSLQLSPTLSRSFAGVSLSGRF